MRPWRRVFTAAVKMPSWFIAAFAAESSPAVVYESMRIVTVGILFSVKGKIVFSSVTARENSNNTSRKFIRDINAELEYCGMIFFPLFLVVVAVLKGDLKFLAVQKPYELLQFLVSKSVACCVPFETYGKHSGAQSAEVVSLLHHLIVDSDPSLYDFIREFEHFPELVIFDRIWKFHQGLCEVYSPRDHFLRFVKRSCNMPPRYCLHGVKKQNILHSNSKPIAIAHQGVSSSGISEISGVHRNLFDKGGPADASVEARGHAAKGDAGEGIKPSASAIPLASGDFFSGDQEKFLALGPLREVVHAVLWNYGSPFMCCWCTFLISEVLDVQLSDLEKLGLSSKQVHNLFSTAAKGIFT